MLLDTREGSGVLFTSRERGWNLATGGHWHVYSTPSAVFIKFLISTESRSHRKEEAASVSESEKEVFQRKRLPRHGTGREGGRERQRE